RQVPGALARGILAFRSFRAGRVRLGSHRGIGLRGRIGRCRLVGRGRRRAFFRRHRFIGRRHGFGRLAGGRRLGFDRLARCLLGTRLFLGLAPCFFFAATLLLLALGFLALALLLRFLQAPLGLLALADGAGVVGDVAPLHIGALAAYF